MSLGKLISLILIKYEILVSRIHPLFICICSILILNQYNTIQSIPFYYTRFIDSVYKYTRFTHEYRDIVCITIPGFYMNVDSY